MTPFEVARKNDVVIVVEPLANIYAYYNKIENRKFIHINDSLPEYSRNYLIAYMLYFALEGKSDIYLLSKNFSEPAHQFAINLLHSLSEEDMIKLFDRLKRLWGIDTA